MQQQTTETARFMQALDEQQPEWHFDLATCSDLRDYIDMDLHNQSSNATQRAREMIRSRVANRLLVAVRAALCAGIVQLPSATVFEEQR